MDIEQESHQQSIFTTWVNTHADDLYSWAYHKTNDKEIAQDLIQDTFLAAFNSIDKFRSDSSPKTWLTRILNNKIIDFYRKKAKELNINVPISKLEGAETDDFFDRYQSWNVNGLEDTWEREQLLLKNDQFHESLIKCIDNLKEKTRFVVTAKYILEKNAKQICQELDITPSNYWQILHRSKLSLKKCIESQEFFSKSK